MDEHILVDGQSVLLSGELLDDNRNTLTWWIAKHNAYASREVVEMLDAEYHFLNRPLEQAMMQHSAGRTRWLKKHFYAHLPGSFRALAYFLYRYIFRLGFLDGIEGSAFHVLQGFWYRYLVDMKLHEVKTYMKKLNTDSVSAIEAVLGLRVSSAKPDSLVAE